MAFKSQNFADLGRLVKVGGNNPKPVLKSFDWRTGDRTSENCVIRLRAAEGSSHRGPGPWCGLGPAWPSTWNEHAASLDSACPQPDGEHIVTWNPATDEQQVP